MDSAQHARIREVFHDVLDLERDAREEHIAAAGLPDEARERLRILLRQADETDEHDLFGGERAGEVGRRLIESATDGALADLPPQVGEYTVLARIGEGGMGVVYEARRPDSTERVALKVLRAGVNADEVLSRFRREADLLGQLRHPGIAAFYETGEAKLEVAGGGMTLPYIAMELVEGRTLLEHAKDNDLDERQRIELVARTCDAMQHAHEIGAVHRDLKPSNIVVEPVEGELIGQPKVLDFGVAHATDADVETRTGALIGTLPYMSPEQAAGASETIDARSDVYSLGVLLFQVLSSALPLNVTGKPLAVAADIIQTTLPTKLSHHSPRFAGPLDWIVAQALEKEPGRRYETAAALARDLRAYLAGRSVDARPPGLWRRVRRLVQRHPAASSSIGVGSLGLIAMTGLWLAARSASVAAEGSERAARESAAIALQRGDEIARQRAAILRLADRRRLRELEERAEELWPAVPERADALARWIDEAEPLVARLDEHRAALEGLARVAAEIGVRELAWWREKQADLVDSLQSFSAADGTLAQVRARHVQAATLWQRSIGDHAEAWRDAIDSIARSPYYKGLRMVPQVGLVPLGKDPRSAFWEFWHVASGTRPVRDPSTGELEIDGETGIVLVLLPGGRHLLGAQADDPDAPLYSSVVEPDEWVYEVELTPFFLGKYELTQGQWLRVRGENPAFSQEAFPYIYETFTDANPVEQISCVQAMRVLFQLDLMLPTEAQWEYAAHAGTTTVWSTGDTASSLEGAVNLADQTALAMGRIRDWEYVDWDDGHARHAPAGTFPPNDFGLHEVMGNVSEWCREPYALYPRDLVRDPLASEDMLGRFRERVLRGANFSDMPAAARVSKRNYFSETHSSTLIGARASRAIDLAERDSGEARR